MQQYAAISAATPHYLLLPRPHPQALRLYRELLAGPDPDPLFYLYCSACLYYMGLFKEAEQEAMQVGGGRMRQLPVAVCCRWLEHRAGSRAGM